MQFRFTGRGLLLDIEGTTSSIRFVHEVMFPYVRRHLTEFLHGRWDEPATLAALEQVAQDAGRSDCATQQFAAAPDRLRRWVHQEVLRLMDADAKTTGLKQLQGLIWEDGFQSGGLVAHVYPEVPDCLHRWRSQGWDIRIYSSGSIQAQKLFFGHSLAGNLLPLFNGHYDTSVGGKKESASYRTIASAYPCSAADILFVSDVPEELDAARSAGLGAVLSIRPENPAAAAGGDHPSVTSFDQLELTFSADR